jgi:hypothetical protein
MQATLSREAELKVAPHGCERPVVSAANFGGGRFIGKLDHREPPCCL